MHKRGRRGMHFWRGEMSSLLHGRVVSEVEIVGVIREREVSDAAAIGLFQQIWYN